MGKKKMTVLSLCLCAVCIALHIILEVFASIRIGNDLKISFATLPFVIVALLCGPLEGFVTGLIGTFLSQLITYGITITTPFWIIPGALQGLAAGLIFLAFKRRTKLVPVAVTVFGAGLVLVIFNWIASYFDGVVFFKYWTIEVLIGLIPLRLLVWVGLSVVYTIVGYPITRALLKSCPGGYRQQKKLAKQEEAAPAAAE